MILLGEMRDLETIATALTAAETGHLVFGTLHTRGAAGTIDRIIDVFPAEQQSQVRAQIAGALQAVVTQSLLPTADGQGRVAALEILLPDDAVRNLIRQGKVEQIYSVMQTGTARGMQTMEQSLCELVLRGTVTLEIALGCSSYPDQLIGLLERSGYVEPAAGGRRRPAAGGELTMSKPGDKSRSGRRRSRSGGSRRRRACARPGPLSLGGLGDITPPAEAGGLVPAAPELQSRTSVAELVSAAPLSPERVTARPGRPSPARSPVRRSGPAKPGPVVHGAVPPREAGGTVRSPKPGRGTPSLRSRRRTFEPIVLPPVTAGLEAARAAGRRSRSPCPSPRPRRDPRRVSRTCSSCLAPA